MIWLLFSYLDHDYVFLCDLDNSVYRLYYSISQRYISQLPQPPKYFSMLFKDISQISQPPPSTPWFVMLTWFAMLGVKRFAMLGWDLLGVDFGCDVFLKFLYSNHLSLSDTDSRFAMLTQFCQKDVVCNAWLGYASFVFLSYFNSNYLSLFRHGLVMYCKLYQ